MVQPALSWTLAAILATGAGACARDSGVSSTQAAVEHAPAVGPPPGLSDAALHALLEGNWRAPDPLGVEHGLHIDGERWTHRVDGQVVRIETCTPGERSGDTLWFRCRPRADDGDGPVEPQPGGEGEPETERGLTWIEGSLVVRPLDELRWAPVAPEGRHPAREE